jgi:opacity protein-like surface antigen
MRVLSAILFSFTLAAGPIRAAEPAPPAAGLYPRAISVFLGAMEVDDQSVRLEDPAFAGDADLDFSTLPGGGIVVEMPFGGSQLETGIEVGAGIAWRNDDVDVAAASINGNTAVRVDIDNSFLLADLGMGVYTRVHLGPGASIYAGGGPAVVYGRHEVGDETVEPLPANGGTTIVLENDEGSDFNVGYYARAGIDFEWQGGYRMGIGARWLGAELTFDDTLGETDIEGVFYFLSFGQAL